MKRSKLLNGSNFVTLGDTCFFSLEHVSSYRLNRALKKVFKKNPGWFKKVTGKKRPNIDSFWLWQAIQDHYKTLKHFERFRFQEPDLWWLNDLPQYLQDHLKFEYQMREGDSFAIVPTLPFADLGYIIEEDGLVEDFYNGFEMHRLFSVKQLGFMHDPVHRVRKFRNLAMPFHHTRGLHQLDVYAVMNMIVARNPELEKFTNLLLAAAISHDGRTPAGGDTTKLAAPKLFNEETNYKDFFRFPMWPFISSKYNLNADELNDVVLGKGLLGSVLDIADKIAYVARDSHMYLESTEENFKRRTDLFIEGSKLLMKDPKICDLWKDVIIRENKAVFKNSKKVYNFLRLRAILFKELYYRRESRFLEYVLHKKVIKYLLDKGVLTIDFLMNQTDQLLDALVNDTFGVSFLPVSFEHSRVEVFKSKSEATDFFNKKLSDGSYIPIFDDFQSQTSSGVNKFNVLKDGKVMTFKEACPKEAEEIESLITLPEEYGVYLIALRDFKITKNRINIIKDLKKS